jgi:hypothetical protein
VFSYDAPAGVVAPPPRRLRSSIMAALAVGVVVAVLGAGVGWLWSEVAPRVAVIKADQGFYYADSEPEQAVAADGWFLILGAIVGIIVAALAWYLLRRYRGPAILVGLTIGSLAAAVLAWWVGTKIGTAQFDQVRNTVAVGTRVNAPLGLRITGLKMDNLWTSLPTGVVAVQALIAAAVYTLFSGFSGYSDLRGDPVPGYQPMPAYQPLSLDNQPLAFGQQSQSLDQSPSFGGQSLSLGQSAFGHRSPSPEPAAEPSRPDQLGPGFTGSSDSATGTART